MTNNTNNTTDVIIRLPIEGLEIGLQQTPDGAIVGGYSTHSGDVPDAIDSLVLAHAVAGIDVTTPAYIEGLQTALAAYWNHYDD